MSLTGITIIYFNEFLWSTSKICLHGEILPTIYNEDKLKIYKDKIKNIIKKKVKTNQFSLGYFY